MRDDIIALHAECMHFMAMQYTKRLCCGVALAITGVADTLYHPLTGCLFLLAGGCLAFTSGRKVIGCMAAGRLVEPGSNFSADDERVFVACMKHAFGKHYT